MNFPLKCTWFLVNEIIYNFDLQNTVDIYDWDTDTEHVSNVTLINTRTTLASCVLIPKGIDGNPTVAIGIH